MCVMTAGAAMSVLGGVGKAVGSLAAGQAGKESAMAKKQMSYYQAQVARNNRDAALQNEKYAMATGQQQTSNTSMRNAAKFANLKTSQAASGVNVNSGSAVDVQASERSLNQLDAETVLNNASRQAYGYRVQASNYDAQANLDIAGADLYQQQANDSETAGYIGAATSILGSASQMPTMFGGGGGGDFQGTNEGLQQYGSAGYAGSSSYGGPR